MKNGIKLLLIGIGAFGAGFAGGYFLGKSLQKKTTDKTVQKAVDEVKKEYGKGIPVERETVVEGPLEPSTVASEADKEAIFRNESPKPPIEAFIRQYSPSDAHRTDYSGIGKEKLGPPPPPVKIDWDKLEDIDPEGGSEDPNPVSDSDDKVLEEMPPFPGEAGVDPMPADSRFVPNLPGVKGTVLPGGDAPNAPFLITEEQYTLEYRHLDKLFFTCYEEDHVLVNTASGEDGEVVEDVERWLGYPDPVALFWQASDDDTQPAETIWVRNFNFGCDIEVELYHRSYADVVAMREGG